MRVLENLPRQNFLIICFLASVVLYIFYIDGLSKNPPGFHIDESVISYNAYTVASTGRSHLDQFLPTYFAVFPREDGSFGSYINPTFVYSLAVVNLFLAPSVLLSRVFSSTLVFLACLLLGQLAGQMSASRAVGLFSTLTALLSPWFFELSRLVFEVTMYPLVIVLFLTVVHRTHREDKWTWANCVMIAFGLALVTYTYTIGRFLGPAFAFGLILFITDKKRLIDVIKIFVFYLILLIPAAIYSQQHPSFLLTGRFDSLSYFTHEMTFLDKVWAFVSAYISDIGPAFLLTRGDGNLRHHIPAMGMVFGATVLLGVIGLGFATVKSWSDSWYRFLIFGLFISVVPGALTIDRGHMLRLSSFPVFLILITVPVLTWLFGQAKSDTSTTPILNDLDAVKHPPHSRSPLRLATLIIMLGSMIYQALVFHVAFREQGPNRGFLYDNAFPETFLEAVANEQRPIYLEGGVYFHAYYFSVLHGVDKSNFVQLDPGQRAPSGSLVLTGDNDCRDCAVLSKRGFFVLYNTN